MLKTVGILLFCLGTFACADDEVEMPSACQEDRARRLNATQSFLRLVPTCDENGDYAALQCYTGIDYCVCYRRNGENINPPTRTIKACDCIRARDDGIAAGSFRLPRCTRDGYYSPKQCNARGCYCVDKDGNQLDEPRTGDVQC